MSTPSPDQLTAVPSTEWCEAQIFREHVIGLMRESGLRWRLIAAPAGVSPSAMHHLLHGRNVQRPRTIHVDLARALMQIDLDDLTSSTTRRTFVGDSRDCSTHSTASGTPTPNCASGSPPATRRSPHPAAAASSLESWWQNWLGTPE